MMPKLATQGCEARTEAPLFCSPIDCGCQLPAVATKHPQRPPVLWTRHAHHELRRRAAVATGDYVSWLDSLCSSLIGHGLTQQISRRLTSRRDGDNCLRGTHYKSRGYRHGYCGLVDVQLPLQPPRMRRQPLPVPFAVRSAPALHAGKQRIVLVVTCAPSLDHCYIFEVANEHLLRDFGKYDADGPEASRRWWKVSWSETTDGIVAKISSKFTETVRGQLESAEKRLSQG